MKTRQLVCFAAQAMKQQGLWARNRTIGAKTSAAERQVAMLMGEVWRAPYDGPLAASQALEQKRRRFEPPPSELSK